MMPLVAAAGWWRNVEWERQTLIDEGKLVHSLALACPCTTVWDR